MSLALVSKHIRLRASAKISWFVSYGYISTIFRSEMPYLSGTSTYDWISSCTGR